MIDLDALAETLLHLTPQGGRPRILIDGGSGAGKTSLARALVERLATRIPHVTLVSLDDLYPGWSGLAAASLMVPGLLERDPGHPIWNWQTHQVEGWKTLPAGGAYVVEGCGVLTPANRELATAAVWCDLNAATRKQRALDRDGDAFRPWWNHWAAQEAWHWRAHRPRSLADVVLDLN